MMNKWKLIYMLLFLPMAGTTFSQTVQSHTAQISNQRKPIVVDLSLWKNVSTWRNDTVGSVCLNLGVLSGMNNLAGVGINILGSIVRNDACGLQMAGLWNLTGQSMCGLQIAGITNVNGNNMVGVSASGLVGINGNRIRGLQMAGLVNINGDDNEGGSISGLMNLSGNQTKGVQLSGMSNITGLNFGGCALSGLVNAAGGDAAGAQIAGVSNITVGNMRGMQLSGLGNVTGGTVQGLQMASINIASRVKGLQIGLFNYYKEHLDGFQLGLVNANPQTRVQMMFYGGNSAKLNIAARFKNRLFYTILGTGMPYLKFSDKFSGALFYRAGLELPLYKRLFVSGDLGYQHIETFKNENTGFPPRLYSLQGRVNLEYRLTDCVGLFVTGGYGWDRCYTQGGDYGKGIIIEGGVVLFKY